MKLKLQRIVASIILLSPLVSFANQYENQYPNMPKPNYEFLYYNNQLQQIELQRRQLREQERQERNYQEERRMRLMQKSFEPRYDYGYE